MLGAYEPIVDRISELITQAWSVTEIHIGRPREQQTQTYPYAVIELEGGQIERERVGPQSTVERYTFRITGVFDEPTGEVGEKVMIRKAKALGVLLAAGDYFVENVANYHDVLAVSTEQEDDPTSNVWMVHLTFRAHSASDA